MAFDHDGRAAGPETKGDATEKGAPLPFTLEHAVAAARGSSEAAKEVLGEPFVDHYLRSRDWEVRQYHRRAVSGWELRALLRGRLMETC